MKLTSEDILLYLTGKAGPEVARACDDLKKDPHSLVSKMAEEYCQRQRTPRSVNWTKLLTADSSDTDKPKKIIRPLGSFTGVVTLCLAFLAGILVCAALSLAKVDAAEGRAEKREAERNQLSDRMRSLEADLSQHKEEITRQLTNNQRLSIAQSIVNSARTYDPDAEHPELLVSTVSFIPANKQVLPESGKVRVTVQNGTYPCKMLWKVGGEQSPIIKVPRDGLTLDLPSGDVELAIGPRHTIAWLQPFGLVHNGKYLGSTVGGVFLRLKDGDTICIHLGQPSPPWNATMLRIHGEWVIVTLSRPKASMDYVEFKRGEWQGNEPFPNTALCWAKEGDRGMAKELAQHFLAHRHLKVKGIDLDGMFRGNRHTNLLVPSQNDKIVPALLSISEQELADHLHHAFEILRKQRPPEGLTIDAEIQKATRLLQEINRE